LREALLRQADQLRPVLVDRRPEISCSPKYLKGSSGSGAGSMMGGSYQAGARRS
jgi:hypothetical protein